MKCVVNATPRTFYPRERDPVSIVQEAGWPQGRSGPVRKKLDYAGLRSPDSPYRGESLYRLCSPGPPRFKYVVVFQTESFRHLEGSTVETSVTICIYRPTRRNIHKTRIFSTVALGMSTLTRYRLCQCKRLNYAVQTTRSVS
jgi:hypothetical protein